MTFTRGVEGSGQTSSHTYLKDRVQAEAAQSHLSVAHIRGIVSDDGVADRVTIAFPKSTSRHHHTNSCREYDKEKIHRVSQLGIGLGLGLDLHFAVLVSVLQNMQVQQWV